jgi:hypothetical protein
MSEPNSNDGDRGDLVGEFKQALYADVEQGPARLEFERRRLVARVATDRATARGRARSAGLWLGLAAAGAAAAVTLLMIAWDGEEPEAAAESIVLSGLWQVDMDDPFAAGATVQVPADAGAKIVLVDGTALWLSAGAELEAIDREVSGVRLLAGRLLARVAPRPADAPFRVATPLAEVTVHGTTFSVGVGAEHSRVRLHEGGIRLRCADETIDVQPGHEVEVNDAGTIALRPIDAAGAFADLLIAEKTAGLAGPGLPQLRMVHEEIEVEPAATPPEPAPEPEAVEAQPGKPTAVKPRPVAPPRIEAAADAGVESPPIADPELAEIRVEPGPADDVVDQLQALMRQGRYEDAVAAADAYLAEHPAGEHADEVLYLRAHCQARAGDLEGGRRSLLDYLARYPGGRYWDRVRDILGE